MPDGPQICYADDPGPGLVPVDPDVLDRDAVSIIQRLREHHHDAYLVGGCVRDLLLGHVPKDYDVATAARPRQVKKACRNSRIIGRRFRLVHVHFHGGKLIEVSTFRRDPNELGPDEVEAEVEEEDGEEGDLLITRDNVFGTEEQDARRRDFTINGLFLDPETEEIVDYVGGVDDLRRRVLRTIGDPVRRIREDPVRILRAVKFVCRLDLTLEPGLAAAMAEYHGDLVRSAPARVSEELLRMLGAPQPARAFDLLAHLGILQVLLPELQIFAHPDGDRSERLERLGHRLNAMEKLDGGKRSLPTAVYMAVLLYDAAYDLFEEDLARGGAAGPGVLDDLLQPFATRCRLSRRDSARMRALFQALRRIDPDWEMETGGKRRRRRAPLREFLRREFCQDALLLFRILVDAENRDQEVLEEWEERLSEVADEEPIPTTPERKPRRRRSRRPRRPS